MQTESEEPIPEVDWNEVQLKIKSLYPSMSGRLKEVAEFVLHNPQTVAFETIAVISRQIKVPPSTLIRFASALDLTGFNELKNIVKAFLMDNTSDYSARIKLLRDHEDWHEDIILPRFAKANRDALRHLEAHTSQQDIQRAVAMMSKARHIFVLGNGRAFIVASYLHYALNHVDKKVFTITNIGGRSREEISNIERGDLLIAISYSPYFAITCEPAAEVAKRGVSVLAITDSPLSPLASISQLTFVVHEARVDTFRSLTASLVLAQVLTIALADLTAGKIASGSAKTE